MFGSIEFKGADQDYEAKVERIAVDPCNLLMFASLVANEGIIKGIRATLGSDKKVKITVTDITMTGPDGLEKGATAVEVTKCGYVTHVHKLGYHQAQAFFVSKWTGLMLSLELDHIWRRLNQTDYTTPLLAEWLPHIVEEMYRRKYLTPLYCYNCKPGIMAMNTKNLDAIVSEGIRSGALVIPEKRLA